MAAPSETLTHAHIFVHPDFPELEGDPTTDGVRTYNDAVAAQIDEASLAVLIYTNGLAKKASEGSFWGRFPRGYRFASNPDGFLIPSRVEAFNKLMGRENVGKATIHGAYLGACVINLTMQLDTDPATGLLRFTYDHNSSGDIAPTVAMGHVLDDFGVFISERENGQHPFGQATVHKVHDTQH